MTPGTRFEVHTLRTFAARQIARFKSQVKSKEVSMSNENKTLVEVFGAMFRMVARPAVTIIFAAVIAQVVVQGITPPDWFLPLAAPVIGWWFVERTVTHIKEGKNND
jgi:hypothetical protein